MPLKRIMQAFNGLFTCRRGKARMRSVEHINLFKVVFTCKPKLCGVQLLRIIPGLSSDTYAMIEFN